MRHVEVLLSDRLADARGREVVFVSHRLLRENARYLGRRVPSRGGAGMIELLSSGVGEQLLKLKRRAETRGRGAQ